MQTIEELKQLRIDASREFTKNKNQNYLDEAHIEKILQTYRDHREIEKELAEVKEQTAAYLEELGL